MPPLEEKPAPRRSQCENQECTCCNANTTKATTAKVVVRLTLELSPTHAAELVELLARHVDWEDFPWAQTIYAAFNPADSLRKIVFVDFNHGTNVFLRRKKD